MSSQKFFRFLVNITPFVCACMKMIFIFALLECIVSLIIQFRAISSVGSEHLPYKQGVTGSNPVSPTTLRKPSTTVGGFFYSEEVLSSFEYEKSTPVSRHANRCNIALRPNPSSLHWEQLHRLQQFGYDG